MRSSFDVVHADLHRLALHAMRHWGADGFDATREAAMAILEAHGWSREEYQMVNANDGREVS